MEKKKEIEMCQSDLNLVWSLDQIPRSMTVHDEELSNVFLRGKEWKKV